MRVLLIFSVPLVVLVIALILGWHMIQSTFGA